MPRPWTLGEGPFVVAESALFYWLACLFTTTAFLGGLWWGFDLTRSRFTAFRGVN